MIRISVFLLHFLLFMMNISHGQEKYWHGVERKVRYHPEGNDIVIQNGNRRFNRALYGGNTAFRTEAGDLPEFAMYLPGMGGNVRFGIVNGDSSKWLIKSDSIKAIYRAGSMLYEIKDSWFGKGTVSMKAIATYEHEGFLIEMNGVEIPSDLKFVVVYGGATGKKFSRDGDIGADPESSFYLDPKYCIGNEFMLKQNRFQLMYEKQQKSIFGIFPDGIILKTVDASQQSSPLQLISSDISSTPALAAVYTLGNQNLYFHYSPDASSSNLLYSQLSKVFAQADSARKQIASRIKINTPDEEVNAMAAPLAIAADAIWEDPSYMHGAVAWRMRLNGWRGPYVADVLGWHNRARKHFSSYALSQLTEPASAPVVMDTALNLARHLEKLGTSFFSSGYISRNPGGDKRAHHYDMNLIYIDELLNHFQWIGDTSYLKEMWPVLVRHLAWEKRNFDGDGDGLYDAYAAIWASDALQYSGGGVTHSSAYNYRANLMASTIARIIGEDGTQYQAEANKIKKAVDANLWLKDKGWYAEYKDLLGNRLVHESPALWTIYHAIDENISDPFQAYQSLRYVDHHIPHIPMLIKDYPDKSLYTLSTSNWQPYTWSLNNVALGELMHTALATWQGGKSATAFALWKSTMLESMYFGASPGNVQQLTFYDAQRGELYRDFADGIGMAGRAMVEGLFGIHPNLIENKLLLKPGFPTSWNHASIEIPDIQFDFKHNGNVESYHIKHRWNKMLKVVLEIPAKKDHVHSIIVNGKPVPSIMDTNSIGMPYIKCIVDKSNEYNVSFSWKGADIKPQLQLQQIYQGDEIKLPFVEKKIIQIKDPQDAISRLSARGNVLNGEAKRSGVVTLFAQVAQGNMKWWEPIDFFVKERGKQVALTDEKHFQQKRIDISKFFNDRVVDIFNHKYISPRPIYPTMQLPVQGIGNWAYNTINPEINDQGLRKKSMNGVIVLKNGIQFNVSADTIKNIVFTSMWDNFPDSVMIPIDGRAHAANLLMAGTTNPMQSRIVNGEVKFVYKDGTCTSMPLKNPENWWPIEQDYYIDGYAFTTDAPRPLRVSLKTGDEITSSYKYSSIKGLTGMAVDGGAATVLRIALNSQKQLDKIIIKSIANDVVIGLMALTLEY